MEKFLTVGALVDWCKEACQSSFSSKLKRILEEKKGLIDLLELLEEVNPCGQQYFVHKDIILITYQSKLNLLSFRKNMNLKVGTRMIGMPISISQSGIWACEEDADELRKKVLEALAMLEGLTVVLNSDFDFPGQCQTLSTFVFRKRFTGFDQYLEEMRSSYRRHLVLAMQKGEDLSFNKVSSDQFTQNHYQLYQSIMKRTEYPLEVLSPEFFRRYTSDVFETRDSTGRLLAFLQMKGIGDTLHFMFCGFEREDKIKGSIRDSASLYQNLLLFIIRYGIENGYKMINMGQTSAETKLKLGCVEEKKFLYIRHSNPLIDAVLRRIYGWFSYKGYSIGHRVFKTDQGLKTRGISGRGSMHDDFPEEDTGEDSLLPVQSGEGGTA